MSSRSTSRTTELAGLTTEPAVFVRVESDCPGWPAITDPGPAVGESIYCSHCRVPHRITAVIATAIASDIIQP
jgi:hypothetical protein